MRRFGLAVIIALAAAVSTAAQEAGTSVAQDSRVFEMRTYHPAPGKMQALHARFRDHTSRLFEKHGMTIIGYWVPIDKVSGEPKGEDRTLVYVLAYPSLGARRQAWDTFSKDPEWQKAKSDSEAGGRLVERVDSVFLKATDYSPIK